MFLALRPRIRLHYCFLQLQSLLPSAILSICKRPFFGHIQGKVASTAERAQYPKNDSIDMLNQQAAHCTL